MMNIMNGKHSDYINMSFLGRIPDVTIAIKNKTCFNPDLLHPLDMSDNQIGVYAIYAQSGDVWN